MILVRVQGGLGNQMFQYAFGKMLAKKNKTALKIDTSLLINNIQIKGTVIRHFDLDIFKLHPIFATQKEITYFNGYPYGNIFQRIFYKISSFFNSRNLIIQDIHVYEESHLNTSDNSCVVGRWQSELYFIDAKEEVLNDFEIKKEWLLNSEYAEKITADKNAVSVHVRREDYIRDENNNIVRNELINGNLDISYYIDALKYIQKNIKDPTFFIFSEDMEWCLANLQFIPNPVFVKTEKSKKGMAEDLHLISLCKHHITSHSTFSWWGAYLSKETDKVIIAPKQWSFTDAEFAPPHIIPDNWVKI